MKKVLLGTASVIGLAMLAQPAAAEITVTLGGVVEFQAGIMNLEAANGRDHEFRTNSEVHVRADGKADNGLLYGAAVEFEADQSETNNVDEAYVYVSGGWGRVELGDNDGAADALKVTAPTVGLGQYDGPLGDFGLASAISTSGGNSGDATKVSYFTPSFGGFQAGISYAPSIGGAGQFGGKADLTDNDAGEHNNGLEVGAKFGGDFGGVAVVVGGGYYTAAAEAAGTEDIADWTLGAQAGYAGFTVGGAYWNRDRGAETNGWNLGVTYSTGALAVGASYGTTDANGANPVNWGVGAAYTVAPGLVAAIDYASVDDDAGREESAIITSVKLSF